MLGKGTQHASEESQIVTLRQYDKLARQTPFILARQPGLAMWEEKHYHVYIMASRRNGTLYIGFSGAFLRRVWEHKNDIYEGFTKRYRVHRLVWYEVFDDVDRAIAREKQLKGWNRAWKIKLIERMNPNWNDLYETLVEAEGYSMKPLHELALDLQKKNL